MQNRSLQQNLQLQIMQDHGKQLCSRSMSLENICESTSWFQQHWKICKWTSWWFQASILWAAARYVEYQVDDHEWAQATYCRAANPSLENLAPVASKSKILQLQVQIVQREFSSCWDNKELSCKYSTWQSSSCQQGFKDDYHGLVAAANPVAQGMMLQ